MMILLCYRKLLRNVPITYQSPSGRILSCSTPPECIIEEECYSLKPLFAVESWLVYFLFSDEIRCLTGHCILSVLRQCHVQEHVLQGLYQAEHLPGRSCLSSIRIPGT